MPVNSEKCTIKSVFRLQFSQRFNTFAVNKIFKYALCGYQVLFLRKSMNKGIGLTVLL